MCDICRSNPCRGVCPNSSEDIIGFCQSCGSAVEKGYEYFTDGEDNLFCTLECALKYYGIESV